MSRGLRFFLARVAWLWASWSACGSAEEHGTEDVFDGSWSGSAMSVDAGSTVPPPTTAPISAPAPLDAAVIRVGICPTGSYEGNFEGEAGFLFALGAVSGLDLFDEQPPLKITLSPALGNEFAVSGNGVMHGTA